MTTSSGLLARVPSTPPLLMRRLAIANLIAQIGIGVTGSVVRVTGSGLGCSTWPQCEPGSMVPVSHAEIAPLHMWIEFGNRLLGVLVVLTAGAAMLAALYTRPRRRRLTGLALAMPLGVVAQAVIGGITVLAGLAWWTVMLHFLASMVLVWFAVLLVTAATEHDGPVTRTVPAAGRGLVLFSTAVLSVLLVAGTLVTAAGPHGGDPETPRLDVDIPVLTQLHVDTLFLYLGTLVGIGFLFHAVHAPATLHRRYRTLVAVVLAQGALGGVQYALGVPELLVSLHVLGAGLVTAAASWMWAATATRPAMGPAPAADTSGNGAERPLAGADRT
ncbi:COX15/CtaA family protein [Pseudonocardia parietis]|uniref:Cytochrome c oxidase assembly protein subunit 15 n=1 Tax=Pseudonocardia parietis TaxID=570936 RepID=A0ABS4VXF7_9PSEU|nr:COX15/CtaA family protein [Pseudonocardia parietis]MBP2368626.1 cytochrome c oxidase assembly protein subunit 15 [Pseudonocardia parietis]